MKTKPNTMIKNENIQEIDDNFLSDFFGEGTTTVETTPEKKEFDPIKGINESNELEIVFDTDDEEEQSGSSTEDDESEEDDESAEDSKDTQASSSSSKGSSSEEIDALSVINNLIEEGILLGFEDAEIESVDDLKELIQANLENAKKEPTEEMKNEYFSKLPEEIKIIAEYAEKGATHDQIRSMFGHFAKVQEAAELNPSTVEGQREIVRQYLASTDYGSPEDIQEEIDNWEDLGELENRAKKFHPKLTKMREKLIQADMLKQQQYQQKQIEAREQFESSIEKALSKTELINVKLPKSERDALRKEITEHNYVSELTGRPLNGLGKALEEAMFVKPNPEFLAELTYFATNPEGFIKKLTEKIKEKEVGSTVRKLKTSGTQSDGRTTKKFVYRGINELK